jgi:hypothetical protein
MLLKYGEKEFDFLPRTFCLPADDKLLREVICLKKLFQKWIKGKSLGVGKS